MKIIKMVIVVILFSVGNAYGSTGLSSLKGLWVIYLGLGLIILTLILLSVFWLKITWFYLLKNESQFRHLKRYIFLSVTIISISGASAFTFHANAPYSQNMWFLSVALIVLAASIVSIVVKYKKLRVRNANT